MRNARVLRSAAAMMLGVAPLTLADITDDPGEHQQFQLNSVTAEPAIREEVKFIPGPTEPLPPTRNIAGVVATSPVAPSGSLSGKIVYIGAGHGWTWDDTTGEWYTQRGDNLAGAADVVEDLGNVDQLFFLAQYCLNAGATVVPMRPVSRQTTEIVIDNDDPQVTFFPDSAAWNNSSSTAFFGSAGDVPYRFVAKSLVETARARYTPNIPAAGFYPVYCWTLPGVDRVNDQLYRVVHSGGTTELRINHNRVGRGWIYLGTYYLEAGTNGFVEISNQSSDLNAAHLYAFADAIRFGNGMGDVEPVLGDGVSGFSRQDEASRYWIQRSVGQGNTTIGGASVAATSVYTNGSDHQSQNVSAPLRQAQSMNQSADGTSGDRIYVSFHSNAGNGRGADGLYNSTSGTQTPNGNNTANQVALAALLGREVNEDLYAVTTHANSPFPAWSSRGVPGGTDDAHRFGSGGANISAYGECRNGSSYANNEFDATIVEVAFHDNTIDCQLMREPLIRNYIARATYQGLVKHFADPNYDGTVTGPITTLPEPPTGARVISNGTGALTLGWSQVVAGGELSRGGDAPTGYRVYISTNGYGFGLHQQVNGGATTALDVTSAVPVDAVRYFRVAAFNAGGESFPSETIAVRRRDGQAPVLIVNGFDRNDRGMNFRQTAASNLGGPAGGGGTYDRVWPRYNNSYDYTIQVGQAVHAFGRAFDSCQNENVVSGAVNLGSYQTVLWILGEESTFDETFSAAEQTLVANFLAAGGHFFVSGSELGWDLDRDAGPLAADRTFLNSQLHADLGGNANDDAGTYNVIAAGGSIFAGNAALSFDDGADFNDRPENFYNADFPDRFVPTGTGATAALSYSGGAGGTAGVQYNGDAGGGRVVTLGFPFETITAPAARAEIMADVLTFFTTSVPVELSGFMVL